MFTGFEKIVEERILKAQREGAFENLRGAGKPIVFEDDRHIPEELRLAHKILCNAGCSPPEIELRKDIKRTEELLGDIQNAAEKYRTLKKLNLMITKLNAIRNSSVAFEMPQYYQHRVVERMAKK